MYKKKRKPQQSFILSLIVALLSFFIFKLSEPVWDPLTLPASDKPLQIYSTKDNLTALYVNAITNAKESITLVIYSLIDPQVLMALKQKKIPVTVVCDAKASPGISEKLPEAKIVRRAGKGLTHQKILVIDKKQVWLGSANLTTDSLRVHDNLVFGIEHDALANSLDIKIKSYDESGWSTIPFKHQKTMVGNQQFDVSILPDDSQAAERLIQLFRAAKKSINVAMFTWTRNDFAEEIIQAFKRGVKVDVVIDKYSGKGASAKIVKMLKDAKISVKLGNSKGLLHHKFVYIDDEILVNGSANWTNSAFKVNDDFFVIVYPLNEEQKTKMEAVWSDLNL